MRLGGLYFRDGMLASRGLTGFESRRRISERGNTERLGEVNVHGPLQGGPPGPIQRGVLQLRRTPGDAASAAVVESLVCLKMVLVMMMMLMIRRSKVPNSTKQWFFTEALYTSKCNDGAWSCTPWGRCANPMMRSARIEKMISPSLQVGKTGHSVHFPFSGRLWRGVVYSKNVYGKLFLISCEVAPQIPFAELKCQKPQIRSFSWVGVG